MYHAVLIWGGQRTRQYILPSSKISSPQTCPHLSCNSPFTSPSYLNQDKLFYQSVHPSIHLFRISFIYLLIFGGCIEEFISLYHRPQVLFLIKKRDLNGFPPFSFASVHRGSLLKRRHQTWDLDQGSVWPANNRPKAVLKGSHPVDGSGGNTYKVLLMCQPLLSALWILIHLPSPVNKRNPKNHWYVTFCFWKPLWSKVT